MLISIGSMFDFKSNRISLLNAMIWWMRKKRNKIGANCIGLYKQNILFELQSTYIYIYVYSYNILCNNQYYVNFVIISPLISNHNINT